LAKKQYNKLDENTSKELGSMDDQCKRMAQMTSATAWQG